MIKESFKRCKCEFCKSKVGEKTLCRKEQHMAWLGDGSFSFSMGSRGAIAFGI